MSDIFLKNRNIDNPERLTLVIYNHPDHFSYSLYDPEKRGFSIFEQVYLENQPDGFSAFKEAFFGNDLFSLPFRKVLIMNRSPFFTFIPNSIYDDSYKEEYIRFLFIDHQGIALNQSIPSFGITILYHLSKEIYDFMNRSFQEPEFIHFSAPLITYFLSESKKLKCCQMIVNLQEKGIDIFCFSNDTLLLGNFFSCNDSHEALYYILFTWKQLKFNQLDDVLLIAGDTLYKDTLIEKIEPYIKQIQCLSVSPEFFFEGVDSAHFPFEIALIPLCE